MPVSVGGSLAPPLIAPLATTGDLALRMQTTFSSAESAYADEVLGEVSAAIRDFTGMSFAASVADAATLDGHGRPDLLLPEWPVSEVVSVAVTRYDGAGRPTVATLAEHVDYEWSSAGVLSATSWKASGSGVSWCDTGWVSRAVSTVPVWPRRPRCVSVVYAHGPDAAMLALVRGICLDAASRVMSNPTGDVRESIGNYSVQHGVSATAGLLIESEVASLKKLRGVKVA